MAKSRDKKAGEDGTSLKLARREFLKQLGFLVAGMPVVSPLLPLFGCRSKTDKTHVLQLGPVATAASACTSTQLTPETAESISAIDEEKAGLRNLKITQYYHDLSQAIAALVGQENANWCTFATWASKTAGTFIRIDDTFKEKVVDFFKKPLPLQDNIIEKVSNAVAEGNLKVFHELGLVFAGMVATFSGDLSFDEAKLERFLDPLRRGATQAGGQDLLRSAIRLYYEAKFETEVRVKTEKILLANGQVGFHEQTRLQDNIEGALNALPDTLKKSPDDPISQQWREFATHHLMRLHLPDGSLELGGKVRPLPGQPLFPPELQVINDPQVHQLLEKFGALDETQGSGVTDWADLDQRMGFILTLFRSRQRDLQLFNQPFTKEQCAAIAQGKVPANRHQL